MTDLAIAVSCLAAALVVVVLAGFLLRARATATAMHAAADEVNAELRDAEAAAAVLRAGVTRTASARRRAPVTRPSPRGGG